MAKTNPWYSTLTRDVYHDETTCHIGNNIERENVAQGTGNLPKCKECKRISG